MRMLRKLIFSLAVIFGGILLSSQPVQAQANGFGIDSVNSTARLLLASTRKPGATINVGVTRVSGEVRWNAADPARSVFSFTAYPADDNAPGYGPEDEQLGPHSPTTANYTVINFKSRRVVPIEGGAVRVTGKLTVSHVERIASYDPSEAYSGPTYGPAIVRSASRTAVFVFKPASSTKEPPSTWTATSVVTGEEFPDLLGAVAGADWPGFVNDEQCVFPSTIGEDFSGPACTGKTVDPLSRTDVQCAMPSSIGEDFAGETCTGKPLQYPSHTSTQQLEASDPSNSSQLVANEVEFQLVLQLAHGESARAGASGE
jgi:polyisoprenoid-binding protein YceI